MAKLIGAFAAICFAALMPPAALAASTDVNYLVVAACGGPTYVAGTNRQATMDVHGNVCGSSSGGGGGAVTIADGANVAQGAKADAAATDSTSSWTVIALLKGLMAQQLSTNPVQTYGSDPYTRVTTNATTVVKNSAGTLRAIVINAVGTTETLTCYDNTAGSGTNPFTFLLTGLSVGTRISLDARFGTGITIVSSGSGAADFTVLFE